MSYFAGAEKKDERVLVPDLGSLTSIYDRYVPIFNGVLAFFGSASFMAFTLFSLATFEMGFGFQGS